MSRARHVCYHRSDEARNRGYIADTRARLRRTLLALIWLHLDKQPAAKITNLAWYTFWYVLPTLPMFLLFPRLLARFGFWPALALSALITVVCFGGLALLVKLFGIKLL